MNLNIKRMKSVLLLLILFMVTQLWSQSSQSGMDQTNILEKLMVLEVNPEKRAQEDWLVTHPAIDAGIYRSGEKELVLSNGLVSRTIRLVPNGASVSLKNLVTREEYIRSVKPEALVTIDGVSFPVGGLSGQKEHGYLLSEWLTEMVPMENAFQLQDFEIRDLTPAIHWERSRWIHSTQWEQQGKEVVFFYTHEKPGLDGITVQVHYEIYDDLPLISKWIVVKNRGEDKAKINHFTSEIIAHPEKNNYVDEPARWDLPNLYLENDYAFGGFTYMESPNAISWETDPEYTSQVNWE